MKCGGCSKGLLQVDRQMGRCMRCGIIIGTQAPKKVLKPAAQAVFESGADMTHTASVPEFNCNCCNHGKHDECDTRVHRFCMCRKAGHIIEEDMCRKAGHIIEEEEEFF